MVLRAASARSHATGADVAYAGRAEGFPRADGGTRQREENPVPADSREANAYQTNDLVRQEITVGDDERSTEYNGLPFLQ